MKKNNKTWWPSMAAAPPLVLFVFLSGPIGFAGSGTVLADELSDILEGFYASESEAQELSDVLGGFEADGDIQPDDEVALSSPSPLHLSGSVGVAGAVNLVSHRRPPETNDRKGLAKLRGELDLTADLNLGGSWRARTAGQAFYDTAYSMRGRDNYTSQTLDEYEQEAELGEAWLQGSPLPGLDLKIGRQIVVWGKSDNIRVTDILNPMDKREPGMTDIEDLRLPVTMSRLDYSIDRWTLTGIVVHEVRFDKWPAYGSDYYTSASLLPEEEKPGFSLENQELALAVNGTFSGWETSFYAAHFFDDSAHVELGPDGEYKRVHARITMLGTAASLARGNWLYKAEAAWFSGLEFAALPGEEKSRLDVLAGVEYAGFTDTTIGLEAANRHLFGFCECLEAAPDSAKENDFQWALRISRDFFHERLETLLLVQAYEPLGQGGALERLEFTYDLSDHWEAAAGIVLYQPGDKPALEDMDECNRLFFRLHYAF
jgi:hypothetical protein